MHIHTVFKVKAESADEAVEKVNDWLLDHCGDGWWFDYCNPDESRISTQVTTEEEFQTLRRAELDEAEDRLRQALEATEPNDKGHKLVIAGMLMYADDPNCLDRRVHDLTVHDGAVGSVFYVDTDRHC